MLHVVSVILKYTWMFLGHGHTAGSVRNVKSEKNLGDRAGEGSIPGAEPSVSLLLPLGWRRNSFKDRERVPMSK